VFDIFMEIMDLYTAALIRLASMLQCTHYVSMGANPDKERKNERIYVHAFSLVLPSKFIKQKNDLSEIQVLAKVRHKKMWQA
jgi:hypothetical protein